MQLFILPFAGGNSNSFNKLIPLIDSRIECIPIEYAGRNTRRAVPLIEDYNEFLIDVVNEIKKRKKNEVSYSLMGYSLGTVLLYDILSNKLLNGDLKHAFLCAKGSLKNKSANHNYRDMSDDFFYKEVIALGGVDKRIENNPRFLEIYMRPVKADFKIWEQYNYKSSLINCNCSIIYSEKDPAAQGVYDWCEIIDGETDFFKVGDNHFFINNNERTVANIINRKLNTYLN